MLNDRSQILLKTLVERYIADGQPIGSKALQHFSGLDISSATIRNTMVDLEALGFVASPHTSAGRIPTALAYRVFVDSLLTVKTLDKLTITELTEQLPIDSPKRHDILLKQIEFMQLSERRVLLILVTSDGDVQNRILQTERLFSASELIEAANVLNEYCSGKTLSALTHLVQNELVRLKSDIVSLMNAAVAVGASLAKHSDSMIIAGEHQLLGFGDLSSNVIRMRQLFALFEQKTALLQLLDLGNHADGVKIYIGDESGLAPLDECSVITAPYRVNGEIVGTLGVIGPSRMDYQRVIPIVDITAQLLSTALSQ